MLGFSRNRRHQLTVKMSERPATIVVIGSSLREGETPRDLDVFTSRALWSEGSEEWRGKLLPEELKIIQAWAWSRGVPRVPIEVHSSIASNQSTTLVIPVPWGTEPTYEVLQQGAIPVHSQWVNGLASALRGEALIPGAFESWRRQAKEVRLHLGAGDKYPRHCASGEDSWEGVTAVANALRHLPQGENLILSLPLGKEILAAVKRGPQEFTETWDAPWMIVSFGEEPKLTITAT